MRIALVIERFLPRGGGVEAVAWKVAHALSARGDDVEVFARASDAKPDTDGPRIHVLGGGSGWQPARVLGFSRRAAKAAPRGRRFDVVQSFSRTRHQDIFRAGGGCHAAYMERAYGTVGSALRRLSPRHAILLGIERAVFGDPSQLILCNSAMVRDEIRDRHPVAEERLAVVPNGVDVERFNPRLRTTTGRSLRAALAPEAECVWLLAGNGFARKGVATALEAMALRDAAGEELWIAGQDDPAPWQAQARRLGVAERTRFLGPRADLPDVYAAADALLLPTSYDAFANVCLEAAASGIPVITSAANGAAAWIGAAGRVVAEPDDAAGFAAALGELADPELRAQLGAAARRRAEATTWDDHVDALHALYARVAEA